MTHDKSQFSGRAPLYLTHGIMGGLGLICAEGRLWKCQRRFVVDVMRKFGLSRMDRNSQSPMETKLLECVDSFCKGEHNFSTDFAIFP